MLSDPSCAPNKALPLFSNEVKNAADDGDQAHDFVRDWYVQVEETPKMAEVPMMTDTKSPFW
jgi:hypothetical protein